MASFPGSTVWQNETIEPALLTAPMEVVPPMQYGLLGKGFCMFPLLSQYRPPFYTYVSRMPGASVKRY
jgi:hypothetical protein